MAPSGNDERPEGRPFLRVVRGNPTPEELAALVAVLMARSGEAETAPARTRSAWSDRSRQLLRHPMSPGPGAWRRSALPM